MKSRLLMLLSLIVLGVGIIGAVLTRVDSPQPVLTSVEEELEEVKILIWTPKDTLTKGQFIDRADLQLQKVPESEALAFGIKDDMEMTFTPKMVVNRTVEKDTPVFPEDIVLPSQAGYFKLIMDPEAVPYPVSVDLSSVVGGVVEAGSFVDVLALGSKSQNLTNGAVVRNIGDLALSPILLNVKVLQVIRPDAEAEKDSAPEEFGGQDGEGSGAASIILQLSRKEVATLTVAKRIAQIEVHLSNGQASVAELSADAGDVMSDFKSVKEYRPGVNSAAEVD